MPHAQGSSYAPAHRKVKHPEICQHRKQGRRVANVGVSKPASVLLARALHQRNKKKKHTLSLCPHCARWTTATTWQRRHHDLKQPQGTQPGIRPGRNIKGIRHDRRSKTKVGGCANKVGKKKYSRPAPRVFLTRGLSQKGEGKNKDKELRRV